MILDINWRQIQLDRRKRDRKQKEYGNEMGKGLEKRSQWDLEFKYNKESESNNYRRESDNPNQGSQSGDNCGRETSSY